MKSKVIDVYCKKGHLLFEKYKKGQIRIFDEVLHR